LPAFRAAVTRRLKEAQAALIERARREGRVAYRCGWVVRKSLQTPHGDLGPVRIPRPAVAGSTDARPGSSPGRSDAPTASMRSSPKPAWRASASGGWGRWFLARSVSSCRLRRSVGCCAPRARRS